MPVRASLCWTCANRTNSRSRGSRGTTLMPLGTLPQHVHELDSTADIVVHCKSGYRSGKAQRLLKEMGFSPGHEPHGRDPAVE